MEPLVGNELPDFDPATLVDANVRDGVEEATDEPDLEEIQAAMDPPTPEDDPDSEPAAGIETNGQ